MKKSQKKYYTVIGYYDNTGQCFLFHENAISPIEACRQVGLDSDCSDDMVFVDVILGEHESLLHTQSDNDKSFFFEDLPEPT